MEPLDPELAHLVHDGMVQAVPGPEVEERVLQGLLARLAAPGPDDGGEGEGLEPSGAEGLGEPAVNAAATSGGGKGMLLAAVLGGATVLGGAWVAGRPRAPEQVEVASASGEPRRERAAEAKARDEGEGVEPASAPAQTAQDAADAFDSAATPVPAPASAPASADARSSPARSSPPRRDAAPPVPTPPADALSDEIQRIAAADAALARGDAEQALRLTREHALAHPHGQLALERRAIELGARCQLARPDATEAAAAFLREHPSTPAAAKVRARCPAAPKEIDPPVTDPHPPRD